MQDPAGELAKLLRGYGSKGAAQISVSLPCVVLAYDQDKGRASVQPLIQTGDFKPAPIPSVPVLGQRLSVGGGAEQEYIPVYKPGDVVLIVCADREIKNALSGQVSRPDTNRQHSLNDAVIVGIFSTSLGR
ncbi:Gp138 family membrane-puncturing spike protein [Paenibacillus campinasensis]|nr:Gp138 family membrane-puncturing spike protein [Paenibacillus campinasensis]